MYRYPHFVCSLPILSVTHIHHERWSWIGDEVLEKKIANTCRRVSEAEYFCCKGVFSGTSDEYEYSMYGWTCWCPSAHSLIIKYCFPTHDFTYLHLFFLLTLYSPPPMHFSQYQDISRCSNFVYSLLSLSPTDIHHYLWSWMGDEVLVKIANTCRRVSEAEYFCCKGVLSGTNGEYMYSRYGWT